MISKSQQKYDILISIIIPHFNKEKIILNCLQSLSNSSFLNKEIIVVDNGSTDNSVSLIKTQFPNVKVVDCPENKGYAGGCNEGANIALGKYLVFLNNDTLHHEGWLEPLVNKLECNKSISSVQPKILNAINRNYFDYAGGSGGFLDKYCFPFVRGRIFETIEKDKGQYDNSIEIFWASGTGFITRKSIFKKVGGFDQKLFAHFEEIDYHWKCKLKGYKVYVQPSSVIYHIGGATLSYKSPQKKYLNHRNSLILMLANNSKTHLMKYLIPRIIFELISILKEIFTFNFGFAYAQIKAIIWIFLNYDYIQNKRQKLKMLDPNYDSSHFYQKSIVIEYFLKIKHEYHRIKE